MRRALTSWPGGYPRLPKQGARPLHPRHPKLPLQLRQLDATAAFAYRGIMAQIKNPFFSFAATGTAAGINVQPIGGGHIARRPARPSTAAPSPGQLDQRDRVKSAAAAWATLTESQKNEWRSLTLAIRSPSSISTTSAFRHGYAKFLMEYMAQAIEPPAVPLIPMS